MKTPTDMAILLEKVTKDYVIHHDKPTLVERFVHGKTERYTALDNISLTIRQGERVGIIGPNGAGKTTLLKIISGITCPTHGRVITRGKIISLIDLEAGFHPDLTGEQNIFINGMLLGMTKEEIRKVLPDIIGYAELRQFIDTPLYTYSTGMVLRLGFSVAIHANPEILILDEGLEVGDEYFKRKVSRDVQRLMKKRITTVMVSHNMQTIHEFAHRIVLLNNGRIIKEGGAGIIDSYVSAVTLS